MERRHFVAAERDALNYLAALVDIANSIGALQRRIAEIPGGNRMLGGLRGSAVRLLEGVLDTMPDNELAMFRRNLDALVIDIGMRNKCKNGQQINGVWMSIAELNVLGDASRAQCLTCDKDVQEQRKCPLAKVLDALSVPNADDGARGCRYFAI